MYNDKTYVIGRCVIADSAMMVFQICSLSRMVKHVFTLPSFTKREGPHLQITGIKRTGTLGGYLITKKSKYIIATLREFLKMIVKCNLRDVIYVTIVSFHIFMWSGLCFITDPSSRKVIKLVPDIHQKKLATCPRTHQHKGHTYGAKLVVYVTLVVKCMLSERTRATSQLIDLNSCTYT